MIGSLPGKRFEGSSCSEESCQHSRRGEATRGDIMNAQPARIPLGGVQRRIYYIDWLRLIALLGVFLAHSSNMFGLLYHPKSYTVGGTGATIVIDFLGVDPNLPAVKLGFSGAMYFITFLPQFGMAAFFLLSGASTWFILRSKSGGQFANERFTRLFLPLVLCFIVIAPFQKYFEEFSNVTFRGTLFQYYPYFFETLKFSLNPQWLGGYSHHLWFLADLFVFSIIALPICLMIKRDSGRAFIRKLAVIGEKPGGLLIFVIPIALIQVVLRPTFPGYQDYADVFMWLTFYTYGYILFSSPLLQHAVEHKGWIGLIIGVGCLVVILFLWATGSLDSWVDRPDYSAGSIFFQVLSSLTTCSWMLVVLSFGRRYLNFSNSFLEYGGRVSLPFFLFHFPVLIVIAFFIIPWQTSIVMKFIFITGLAFLGTLVIAHLFVQGMRIIGGKRGKGKKLVREPEIAGVADTRG